MIMTKLYERQHYPDNNNNIKFPCSQEFPNFHGEECGSRISGDQRAKLGRGGATDAELRDDFYFYFSTFTFLLGCRSS